MLKVVKVKNKATTNAAINSIRKTINYYKVQILTEITEIWIKFFFSELSKSKAFREP